MSPVAATVEKKTATAAISMLAPGANEVSVLVECHLAAKQAHQDCNPLFIIIPLEDTNLVGKGMMK